MKCIKRLIFYRYFPQLYYAKVIFFCKLEETKYSFSNVSIIFRCALHQEHSRVFVELLIKVITFRPSHWLFTGFFLEFTSYTYDRILDYKDVSDKYPTNISMHTPILKRNSFKQGVDVAFFNKVCRKGRMKLNQLLIFYSARMFF